MSGSGAGPLGELARAAGVQRDWTDALGEPQRVADEALARVLTLLGHPARTEAEAARSLEAIRAEEADEPSFLTADQGRPVPLPAALAGWAGGAELLLEDGSAAPAALRDGRLSPVEVPGYHRLRLGDRELRLAVAPPRCWTVADAAPGRRAWGAAVQIPSLRGGRAGPYGDFGTLAEAVRALAALGADAAAISPVHALFPADASRFSPYAPSSRLFLNAALADPALAGASPNDAPGPGLIEWEAAVPERLRALRDAHSRLPDETRGRVEAFRRKGGEDLERHATFDALHAHFLAEGGARGWTDWPEAYRDPAGPAVACFARERADEVGFYVFLQWLAAEGLAAAQAAARDAGMAVGLVADLAVGMDPSGSHAWSRPGDVLKGLQLGAPPDLLAPDGQGWGITGFSPRALARSGYDGFVRTIRAALAHAGGVRIDHALGLSRLWVVPDGASPRDGAYLTMPMTDMLRLVALESARARAIVIGEDLGTVPEGLRPAMRERGVLGMAVLPFEQDEDGRPTPPADWRPDAAAMTGTHDLATVAGWWKGRDIDWTWKLGRTSRAESEAADRGKRAGEKRVLWQAFRDAGAASGPEPDAAGPAVDAALAYVGGTPCPLAVIPLEDLLALEEQPNLPGTIDEHPNWRRRMPDTTEAMLARTDAAARIGKLNAARAGAAA